MNRPKLPIFVIVSAILACVTLAGCDTGTLEYIPNGGVYTMTQAEDMASSVSLKDVDNMKTEQGPGLREKALLELRAEGTESSQLADALTRDFPSGVTSVPLRVESATVDGADVWLVVEAWGDAKGTLSRRRLWVLDRSTFTVLASSSFN